MLVNWHKFPWVTAYCCNSRTQWGNKKHHHIQIIQQVPAFQIYNYTLMNCSRHHYNNSYFHNSYVHILGPPLVLVQVLEMVLVLVMEQVLGLG